MAWLTWRLRDPDLGVTLTICNTISLLSTPFGKFRSSSFLLWLDHTWIWDRLITWLLGVSSGSLCLLRKHCLYCHWATALWASTSALKPCLPFIWHTLHPSGQTPFPTHSGTGWEPAVNGQPDWLLMPTWYYCHWNSCLPDIYMHSTQVTNIGLASYPRGCLAHTSGKKKGIMAAPRMQWCRYWKKNIPFTCRRELRWPL